MQRRTTSLATVPDKPPIYGFEIAFTSPPDERSDHELPDRFLDPYASEIVAAGLSTPGGEELIEGSEADILSSLDRRFAELEPGIISTWNGSIVGLPLLRARARANELRLGLRIHADRRRRLRAVDPAVASSQPTVQIGSTPAGGVRPVAAAWHGQRHLDLRWVCGDPADELDQDPCRTALLARSLTDRRWARAHRHLDRVPGLVDPPVVPQAAVLRHPSVASVLRHPSAGRD